MWGLAELGLECVRHDVGHRFGGTDTPEFGAMNPNRTVPVLQDGDLTIWESGAILRYLAARYGTDSFWPADPVARAAVDMWAEWAKVTVAMNFTVPIFWRVVRTPAAQRDPAAIRAAVDALEDKLSLAEDRLQQQEFLAGPVFTLADVQFGHILFRYFDVDIDRRALPAVRRYFDGLCSRPAYRTHVMVSYDALRASDETG